MTYKALIWSVLSYAAPVWFLTVSTESIKALQVIQNAAARIATGCQQKTSIDHLHAETQLLSVEQSLGFLCSQYLASALRPNHPSFTIVSQPRSQTPYKHTLRFRYLPSVSSYLTGGTIDPLEYENIRNDLHHQTVQAAIQSQTPNPILQGIPPIVHPVEKKSSMGIQNSPFSIEIGLL